MTARLPKRTDLTGVRAGGRRHLLPGAGLAHEAVASRAFWLVAYLSQGETSAAVIAGEVSEGPISKLVCRNDLVAQTTPALISPEGV